MNTAPYSVLFLCTGNSARSILAESLLNHMGHGRFQAFSAGSRPRGEVHPAALAMLEKSHLPTAELRSKSWEEFAVAGAPQMDFVVTVCDNAAGEVCPVWPGQPISAHWGIPDPAAARGDDEAIHHAFMLALGQLQQRISAFVALPHAKLDRIRLTHAVRAIGQPDSPA